MKLPELLAFTVKARAQELRLIGGSSPMLKVPAYEELRRVNLPALTKDDIDALVRPMLDAAALDALRFGGKCEGTHEVQGLGKFGYRIAPGEVVIIPPQPPAPAPASEKRGFFGKLFGG
jgi:Tfp pilus assembly pilus retraction ATPase PilT